MIQIEKRIRMLLKSLRQKLTQVGRQMYEMGLVTKFSGNISMRDPHTGFVAIKPSGVPWQTIKPQDVVIIDVEGTVIDGDRKPSIETPMHTAIYRHFVEFNAVVHSHSTYATGFAVSHRPIPAICVNSLELGGEVPVIPYFAPGSSDLAKAVIDGLTGRNVILMAKHGVICCGKDFDEALALNMILEEIAHLALIREILSSKECLSTDQIHALQAI
jgi:ribulose-5-phosphate 4-epimerase/fuculose-1-phosphate aldolase